MIVLGDISTAFSLFEPYQQQTTTLLITFLNRVNSALQRYCQDNYGILRPDFEKKQNKLLTEKRVHDERKI